jgi:hypothetical protein
MNTSNESKINQLLRSVPAGTVLLSSWMKTNGYSLDLQRRYRNSNWFESLGNGAMIRKGDSVSYEGALFALQKQANLSIHIGGRSALNMLGKAHFLELSSQRVFLFGPTNENLPVWFRDKYWGVELMYTKSDFLPKDVGLTEYEIRNFSIRISNPARALMECLYLAPKKQSLLECNEIMESLTTLVPSTVQLLLESCTSVKVKRLFLYLAEKSGHAWTRHINLEKIDLGSGKRSIIAGGAYNVKYQITVNKELEESNERDV